MASVLLQVGHWNIEQNSNPAIRTSTGANGERDYFWYSVVPEVRRLLELQGVHVSIVDANYHSDVYAKTYDLFLSFHYDAGGTESRCMVAASSVPTGKGAEYIKAFCEVYPRATGIALRQDRVTANMQFYYGFSYTNNATPSAIIECGNSTCPSDHDIMHDNPALIARAVADSVLKYLRIENGGAAPVPTDDQKIEQTYQENLWLGDKRFAALSYDEQTKYLVCKYGVIQITSAIGTTWIRPLGDEWGANALAEDCVVKL